MTRAICGSRDVLTIEKIVFAASPTGLFASTSKSGRSSVAAGETVMSQLALFSVEMRRGVGIVEGGIDGRFGAAFAVNATRRKRGTRRFMAAMRL